MFIEHKSSLIGVRQCNSIAASGIPQFRATTDPYHSQMSALMEADTSAKQKACYGAGEEGMSARTGTF